MVNRCTESGYRSYVPVVVLNDIVPCDAGAMWMQRGVIHCLCIFILVFDILLMVATIRSWQLVLVYASCFNLPVRASEG